MSNADQYMPIFGSPISPWKKSFAWLPRWTADAGVVWLRPVYRRRIQSHDHLSGPMEQWWQYLKFKPGPRSSHDLCND